MRVAVRIVVGLAILFFFAYARADTIYRCDSGGTITFSDRPCGADAQKFEPNLNLVSHYEPVATHVVTEVQSRPVKEAPPDASIAQLQAKHAEECRRIRESLGTIRSQMRAGYNAKQGERMKERERKLNESRRAKRC
ncbi:MAG TPA: hypothetical protein VFS24_03140 [Steroidobacteraceae bacterium]|nr:hypothetical protein [Steroidobacteraceae bacterium]